MQKGIKFSNFWGGMTNCQFFETLLGLGFAQSPSVGQPRCFDRRSSSYQDLVLTMVVTLSSLIISDDSPL